MSAPATLIPLDTRRQPQRDVVIVGAGASGTLTAAALLRGSSAVRVVLVERSGDFGPGLAYGAARAEHLLNVPAARLSARSDDPDDWLNWARRRCPWAEPTSFLPRRLYGDYLRDTLLSAEAGASAGRLERITAEAIAVDVQPALRRAAVTLDSGRRLAADRVVLAFGNFPPAEPPALRVGGLPPEAYTADPWAPGALDRAARAERVLLVGTGLTMVDMALSLGGGRRRRRELVAVSRHGLLHRAHRRDGKRSTRAFPIPEGQLTVGRLLEAFHQELLAAATRGEDWHFVVDSLRPVTAQLWRSLPETERTWFLARLARWWEVHRHRMAPACADSLDALQRRGHLRVRAAAIERVRMTSDGVEAVILPTGSGRRELLTANHVINCTGPQTDIETVPSSLLVSLLRRKLVRPDPHRLGLDVDDHGALLDARGLPSDVLFTLGPARKGQLYETTAIPEIRVQAERLAARLTSELSRDETRGLRAASSA